jgi:hypothetical protein
MLMLTARKRGEFGERGETCDARAMQEQGNETVAGGALAPKNGHEKNGRFN